MNHFGMIGLMVLIGMNGWFVEHAFAQRIRYQEETGSYVTGEEAREIIDLHNRIRSEVGSGPLAWSKEIAGYAQEWVNHLAKTACSLRHRPLSGKYAQKHGENGFIGTIGYHEIGEAIRLWELEKQDYKGQGITGSNYRLFGHYTQVVWRTSTQMGCGKAECNGRILFFCNYHPRGNIFGEMPY